MWATCPAAMKKCKVGEVGSFNRFNHHGGVMPGWPSESTMSNQRASKILLACIKSKKLTLKQLEAVRKCLSFLWELTGKRPNGMAPGPVLQRTGTRWFASRT